MRVELQEFAGWVTLKNNEKLQADPPAALH
jgi:hypothetical protein